MKNFSTSALLTCLMACYLAVLATPAAAEQKVTHGDFEIHYIVIPTTFLKPRIASQYGLIRGQDRALVNVSVLDADSTPVKAVVSGTSKNLLGQLVKLEFHEVAEGAAVYYLAILGHGNEEHRTFDLEVALPDGATANITFEQKMYWQH